MSIIAKLLISNMMCIETMDRFTARRILDDVWFTVCVIFISYQPPKIMSKVVKKKNYNTHNSKWPPKSFLFF